VKTLFMMPMAPVIALSASGEGVDLRAGVRRRKQRRSRSRSLSRHGGTAVAESPHNT
jgi:hypothetical protein